MLFELIEEIGHASSYGSGAIKSLQNDILPDLDLLVREAVQNSSDAALGIKLKDKKRIGVDFNVKEFEPAKLNDLLGCLKNVLNERFPSPTEKYMEIRDSDTSGLTGPVRLSEIAGEEDHGNYWKLVFDTGKEQTGSENGEAGGSWGYGKSVYYRIGIGIVLFYSRIINENDSSEERLIISLTEHETDGSSLLKAAKPEKRSIGRAWWGKEDPSDTKEILPITDPDEIQIILDIFGVKRFEGKTGTSIIIPYINEQRLLEGIFPEECGISEEEQSMCSWKDSVEKYLQLAVEKWYAPRLYNKKLNEISGQKWIGVRINGVAITDDQMRPFFQLVQELYNSALSKCHDKPYESEKYKNIKTVEIKSARIKGEVSGWAAYIKISEEQLGAGGSIIKPYTYLRLFGKNDKNDSIVLFARKPGMILDYKIDGPWAKNIIQPEADNEYVIVFYVPKCDKELKNERSLGQYANMPLGEYLRKCEKSDHMDWTDKAALTIAERIKSNLAKYIRQSLDDSGRRPPEGDASRLSGKLGRRLLPSLTRKRGGGGSGGGGSHGRSGDLEPEFSSPVFYPEYMDISFKLVFKNSRVAATICVFVESEVGIVDAETWEKIVKTDYPIELEEISEVAVYSANSGKNMAMVQKCCPDTPSIKNDYSEVSLIRTESGNSVMGFRVKNVITNATVWGKVRLKTNNKKLVCTVKEIRDV